MIIKSKIKEYSCEFMDNLLDQKEKIFPSSDHRRYFYFIDENFQAIYKHQIKHFIDQERSLTIAATESNKEYTQLAEYYKFLIEAGMTRGGYPRDIRRRNFTRYQRLYRLNLVPGHPLVFFPDNPIIPSG